MKTGKLTSNIRGRHLGQKGFSLNVREVEVADLKKLTFILHSK